MKNYMSRLVLVFAFCFSGAAHADAFNSLTMEFGADRWGSDYKSFELSTNDPLACQIQCAQDSLCKAYTFVPAGILTFESRGPVPRCYLKNAEPATSKYPGLISGRKLP
jgi:hypothetical protein